MAARSKGRMNNRNAAGMDSVTSFLGYELLLQSWIANVDDVVAEALSNVVGDVEATATTTDAYDDDTSATRNSTIAYVAVGGQGLPAEVAIAAAVANGYRAGSATDEPPPEPAQDTVELVSYSATDYSFFLNIRNAGASMFHAEAIEQNMGAADVEVARAIAVMMTGRAP